MLPDGIGQLPLSCLVVAPKHLYVPLRWVLALRSLLLMFRLTCCLPWAARCGCVNGVRMLARQCSVPARWLHRFRGPSLPRGLLALPRGLSGWRPQPPYPICSWLSPPPGSMQSFEPPGPTRSASFSSQQSGRISFNPLLGLLFL